MGATTCSSRGSSRLRLLAEARKLAAKDEADSVSRAHVERAARHLTASLPEGPTLAGVIGILLAGGGVSGLLSAPAGYQSPSALGWLLTCSSLFSGALLLGRSYFSRT
jgi:hypothetical protein